MSTQQFQASSSVSSGSTPRGFHGASLSPTTLLLLTIGTLAGLLFAAVYLIEGATRPGYATWREAISALSLGPGGWVQQINFVLFGLLTLITAIGWRQALTPGLGARWYPILRGVEGVGLITDGFFNQDPSPTYPPGAATTITTFHGTVHVLFAFVTITALAISNFVIARRFAAEPRWRGWALFAILTGVLTMVFIAIFGSMSSHAGSPAGIFERLATGVNSLLGLAVLTRLWLDRRQGSQAKL